MNAYEGILPIHKPAGFTSHDVVAKCRGILKMKRIGHTGTLDPAVTGVLPLCLGRATRMVEYLQDLPKEYEATLVLGVATDTEDMTGEIIEQVNEVQVTEEDVRRVLSRFVGTISQIPPMYSALKQDGKRLYELAREGKTVERKPREVTIYQLELLAFHPEGLHPRISFRALCSKGTYIRTLCVDIGRALGVPAAMTELKRTMSAGITESHCLTLDEVARHAASGSLQDYLLPVDRAVQHLPAHTVAAEKVKAALQGQRLSPSVVSPAVKRGETLRLYSPEQQFLGIFRVEEGTKAVKAVKVFLPE
ncbi:tRNA pseudouridine synthase B [Paenibacillus sp. oral taxon 786 str. D14]|uniref:tRNA pseudouridine(55) synthase TruB n=1 Tax=Paenibacillus sp. oral taxon 786 TaxID=652715 RepID=UPI0001AFCDC1|nr:tRNA pseudouridine(55) synthase TruB [Paenibacillus sp. oral taxon 786]EES75103.1 tRNA pseudouridine synthase B [Paenibacillus sp. oral taxon 786 str. D14]